MIVNPVDFQTFIKSFRGLQCKKEDQQIELRNLVLEWKNHLRNDQNTQEIRTRAYELIDIIESLHDEQDMLLESENKKLELMVRECAMNEVGSHRISGDFGGVDVDQKGHESHGCDRLGGATGDKEGVSVDKHGVVSQDKTGLEGTKHHAEEFTELHKEISRRQQYLQMFNNQSTIALKRALLDIEACRRMVEHSKDFVDNVTDEDSSSSESSEEPFPHPV